MKTGTCVLLTSLTSKPLLILVSCHSQRKPCSHFGFYLAWGDSVWLPMMYTLQAQYLARYPRELSPVYSTFILCSGLFGYFLFRAVNWQKDIVRKTGGNCKIWGRKPRVIAAKYLTSDGIEHTSLLLCSGK